MRTSSKFLYEDGKNTFNAKMLKSTIAILAIILMSVFPLTQIMLLTTNGGLSYFFALPFGAANKSGVVEVASVITNSILTIMGLLGFYFAVTIWQKSVSTFLIMFAGQMLMVHLIDEFNAGDEYLRPWLAVSVTPIISIAILGIIKRYLSLKLSDGATANMARSTSAKRDQTEEN